MPPPLATATNLFPSADEARPAQFLIGALVGSQAWANAEFAPLQPAAISSRILTHLICRLVGFELFTALSIYSPFQNPVNPPILLIDWLIKAICLPQNPSRSSLRGLGYHDAQITGATSRCAYSPCTSYWNGVCCKRRRLPENFAVRSGIRHRGFARGAIWTAPPQLVASHF